MVFRAGAREAWLLIRHPVHIAGWVLLLALVARDTPMPGYDIWSAVPLMITAFVGIPTFAAASLLATRPRRTGTDEWLSTVPTSLEARWAISLMAAVGPFLLSIPAAALLWHNTRTYTAATHPSWSLPPQYVYQCAAGPACVLGAGLLAALVARWFPWPLVPLMAMTCLVVVTRFGQDGPMQWFTPYVHNVGFGINERFWLYPAFESLDPEQVIDRLTSTLNGPSSHEGVVTRCSSTVCSMPWHVTYLLGLDLLVIVGVFLVGRYRWYAAAAALPVLCLIATASIRQLL